MRTAEIVELIESMTQPYFAAQVVINTGCNPNPQMLYKLIKRYYDLTDEEAGYFIQSSTTELQAWLIHERVLL